MYSEEEVQEATLDYFGGDALATNVFMTKYCLRDKKGNFVEKTPQISTVVWLKSLRE